MDKLEQAVERYADRLHAIELALSRIVSTLESEQGTSARSQTRVIAKLDEVVDAIMGTAIEPGHRERIRSLERWRQNTVWGFRLLWAVYIPMLAKLAWDLVTKGGA
jgi:hypothetical protein